MVTTMNALIGIQILKTAVIIHHSVIHTHIFANRIMRKLSEDILFT